MNETLKKLWKHAHQALQAAEQLKWDIQTSAANKWYNQGKADGLRLVCILIKEDHDIDDEVQEEWGQVAGGMGRITVPMLCPLDGKPMDFVRQNATSQRYKCPDPSEHGQWEFDWRCVWEDR